MKLFKKGLALLLSIAMVIGTLTTTALADVQGKLFLGATSDKHVSVTYYDGDTVIGESVNYAWDAVDDAWETIDPAYADKFDHIVVSPLNDFTGDDSINTTMTIPKGATVIFDIDGKAVEATNLMFALTAGTSAKKDPGAKLTIIDSESDSTGYLKSSANTQGVVANVQAYATLNMTSGTIKECSSTNTTYGGAIRIRNNGTFNFSGGKISKCTSSGAHGGAIYNSGTLNISGTAVLERNDAAALPSGKYGLGVYNDGIINMTGGKIHGFAGAKTTAAVYNTATSTFVVSSADGIIPYISGNTYKDEGATIKMSAGYLDRNDIATDGKKYSTFLDETIVEHGTYMKQFEVVALSPTVTVDGVKYTHQIVEKTKAAKFSDDTGNFYTVADALVEANGKTIELLANAASVDVLSDQNVKLTTGDYQVTGNVTNAGTLEIVGGTYGGDVSATTISGGFFDSANHTITADIKGGYFTSEVTPIARYSCENNEDPATMGTYPYVVVFSDYVAQNETTGVKYATVGEALNAAGNGDTIKMLGDSPYDAGGITYNKANHVILDLDGHTLTSRLYVNNNSAYIEIVDTAGGGSISSTRTNSNGGVFYINDGTVEAKAGTITASELDSGKNGGLVYIKEKGTFLLSGATLTGGSATKGGAIYNMGTFTMTSGAITNCTSTDSESGAYSLVYDSGIIYQTKDDNATKLPITTISGGSITGTYNQQNPYRMLGGTIIKYGIVTISGSTAVANTTIYASGDSDTEIAQISFTGGTMAHSIVNISTGSTSRISVTGALIDAFTYSVICQFGTEYTNPIDNTNRIGNPVATATRYHFCENTDPETSTAFPYMAEEMTQIGYIARPSENIKVYHMNEAINSLTAQDTIELIASLEEDGTVPAGKDVIVDFNGYEMTGNVTVEGTLAIKDGTVTGAITNNGTLTITNMEVTGAITKGSGATTTINSGTFASTVAANTIAAGTFNGAVTATSISGGTFNENVTATNVNGGYFDNSTKTFTATNVTGGYFKADAYSLVATGHICKPNEDAATKDAYPYVVEAGTYKVINTTTGKGYLRVRDALDTASSGDTIQLQEDITGEATGVTFNKAISVTLDLNGYTLTSRLYVNNADANLTITDTSSPSTGKISSTRTDSNGGAIYIAAGSVTANAGTIEAQALNDGLNGGLVYISNDTTFTLAGATLTGGTADRGGAIFNGGTFYMTSGTITGNTSRLWDDHTIPTIYDADYYSDAIYQYTGTSGKTCYANISGGYIDDSIMTKKGTVVVSGTAEFYNTTIVSAGASKTDAAKITFSGGKAKQMEMNIVFGTLGNITLLDGAVMDNYTYSRITWNGTATEYTNPITTQNRIGVPDPSKDRYHFIANTAAETSEEYPWTVEQMTPVAIIEEEEDLNFYHLSDAFAELEGKTGVVILQSDVAESATIPATADITLDSRGYTITGDITNNGTFSLVGQDTIDGNIDNFGALTVDGYTVTGNVTAESNSTTTIPGGKIGNFVVADGAAGNTQTITGGYFADDNVENYLTESYEIIDHGGKETYRYQVAYAEYRCIVSGATDSSVNIEYSTVQEAIAAIVASGESGADTVITLERNIQTADPIVIPAGLTVTIDYNGCNVAIDDEEENPIISISQGAALTVIDSSENHYAYISGEIENAGTLNIGKYNADGTTTPGGHYKSIISYTTETIETTNIVAGSFVNEQAAAVIDPESIVVTGFTVDPEHGCLYKVKSKNIVNIATLKEALEDSGSYVVKNNITGTMVSTDTSATCGSYDPATGTFATGKTTIDLDGHNITFKASRNPVIDVATGSTLTINDSSATHAGKVVGHTPTSTNSNPNILVKVESGATFNLEKAELDAGQDKRDEDSLELNGDVPGTAIYTEGTVNIKQNSVVKGNTTTDTVGGSAIYVAGGTTTIYRASVSTTDANEVIYVAGGTLTTTTNKNAAGYPVGPEISGYLGKSDDGTINLTAGYFTYDVDENHPEYMATDCICETNTDDISLLPFKINSAYVAMNLDTGLTYNDVQEAINAAGSGETIFLAANINTSGLIIEADDDIILDINGKTILGDGTAPIITNNGKLQIIDSTPAADNGVLTMYDTATSTQNIYVGSGAAINNVAGAELVLGGQFTRDGEELTSDIIYIQHCETNQTSDNNGGAIYNGVGSTVTADGLDIHGCEAYRGGAIYNEQGSVSLANTTITECIAASGNNGTSIYNRGDLELETTTIVGYGDSDKSVINNYGYGTGSGEKKATMTIAAGSTDVFISGKVSFSNGYKSYVAGGYFTVASGNLESLQTGYTFMTLDTPVLHDGVSYSYTPYLQYVAMNQRTGTKYHYLQNVDAPRDSAINQAASGETIILLGDITGETAYQDTPSAQGYTYQYYIGTTKNITIDLNGYTITETPTDADGTLREFTMFQVGGNLEITDSVGGGAITQGEYNADAGIVYDEKGGGVYVAGGGTFTLSGKATIKNCYTYGQHVSEDLEDDTASYGGGGIYNNGKLVLCGDSVIQDCQALNNKGGGVYNNAGTEMIMKENATITGCRSYGNGGGIHTYAASTDTAREDMTSVCMYGGTIEKCWAGRMDSDGDLHGNGGAICISSNCIAFLFGGTIQMNRAYNLGGAIYISHNTTRNLSGELKVYGIYGDTPTITNNQVLAVGGGGGVYLAENAEMGVWGSLVIDGNHRLSIGKAETQFINDTTYEYIGRGENNNLFVRNDTVKVDGPLVTGTETAGATYTCAAADTTDPSVSGATWSYDSAAGKGYDSPLVCYGDYATTYGSDGQTRIRISVPTLEENPIFAKTFSQEEVYALEDGTSHTVQTPGSDRDNFNTYTHYANAADEKLGTPVIDSDESRFDVVASREIWDENEVPQSGSFPSGGVKSDDYNNVIYLFLAEIDSASVTLANQLAINYQCSITESKYQAQLAKAGSADVMLLEVEISSDPGGKVILEGKDAGRIYKYDELTCADPEKTTEWHKWIFTFDGIDPCWMAEDITVNMYLGYYSASEGRYIKTSKRLVDDNVYSVAEYCNDVYDYIVKGKVDPYHKYGEYYADMKALLADIMMYGETAQLFQNYEVDTLCSKVDWAYTYDGRGEITSRTMINTKTDAEITKYDKDNLYWDVRGAEALGGANNRVFDNRGFDDPTEAVSDQKSARWSWIETYRTNKATTAAEQVPASEDIFKLYAKNPSTSGLVDTNTDNYSISGATCMFGKGGYIVPRFYCDLKGADLSNYRIKAELFDASGNPVQGIDEKDPTVVNNIAVAYCFDAAKTDQGLYYIDFGKTGEKGDQHFQLYPQEFGYQIKISLQVKTTAGKWRSMQTCVYTINNYFYDWVHEKVDRPSTMSQTQYEYMQDLAYAAYRYGQSTAKLNNDIEELKAQKAAEEAAKKAAEQSSQGDSQSGSTT